MNLQRHNPENDWSDEDSHDAQVDDEKPLVVVLKPGDLTAEEAEAQAVIDGHQHSGAEGSPIFYSFDDIIHIIN